MSQPDPPPRPLVRRHNVGTRTRIRMFRRIGKAVQTIEIDADSASARLSAGYLCALEMIRLARAVLSHGGPSLPRMRYDDVRGHVRAGCSAREIDALKALRRWHDAARRDPKTVRQYGAVLAWDDGYGLAEIARRQGCTYNTAAHRLRRGLDLYCRVNGWGAQG